MWTVNLEDSQNQESWLIVDAEEEDNEDCIKYMGEIPKEMVSLYHELNLLERRLEKLQVDIQVAKLELNEDEEVVIYDKSEKEVVRDIKFLRKQSETFVLEDLNNYGKNLCIDTGKHEVSSKQDIISEDQIEAKVYEDILSLIDGIMLSLQYGEDKQEIVLKGNKRGEIVECNLKPEMMSEMEKKEGLKQNRTTEIENVVELKTENKISEGYQCKRNVYNSYVYEKEVWMENYNAFIQKKI